MKLIYREWSWQSYQEKGALKMKALAVTEVFITLGSNGMQCIQGKVAGYLEHLGKARVIVFYVVPHLTFSVSPVDPRDGACRGLEAV